MGNDIRDSIDIDNGCEQNTEHINSIENIKSECLGCLFQVICAEEGCVYGDDLNH